MTIEELNYIKDAFSQIIEDIAGNPDWYEAARAVASDLGTLERELGKKVASLPSNLDEAARKYGFEEYRRRCEGGEYGTSEDAFKAGAEWMAGQGVSVDGKVIMDFSEPYDIINRRLIAKLGDALLEIEPGEVVVQIRKK